MDKKSSDRLLLALSIIQEAGGSLNPIWNSHAREGFEYRVLGNTLTSERFRNDLEFLTDAGYLERVFIDRISLCSCGSHALNVREVCLACRSAHLLRKQAILHFRCGYVGAMETYTQEEKGLRCPKCHKILQDIGTDHDSSCEYFSCLLCNENFQVPEIGARCLSCGAHFSGTDFESITQRDVYAYRLLEHGKEALRAQALPEECLGAKERIDHV